jgi:hypothetical protein
MTNGRWQRTEPAVLGDDHPEAGSRTGEGVASILPYLINALKTKSRVAAQPEDAEPGVEFPQSRYD